MKHSRRSLLNGYYALRWRVLERDRFTCQCCGQSAPSVHLEVDHIIPVAEGGSDDEGNLRATCYACNRGRNALSAMLRTDAARADTHIFRKPLSGPWRQNDVLRILRDYPDGAYTSDIATQLSVSVPYARVLIHRLRKAGHIERLKGGLYKIYHSV